MKKILVCMLVCLFCAGVQAQKTAKIKATAVGYTGKVIDFEFIDNTANNQQFPFKDNQLRECEVELKEPGLMKVNAWLWMIVCPGDEIEMAIQFQGKNYKHVEFKGTPAAVTLNSAIRDGRMVRINDHYKTNPLAAVVTQVPVQPYYDGGHVPGQPGEISVHRIRCKQKTASGMHSERLLGGSGRLSGEKRQGFIEKLRLHRLVDRLSGIP